MFKATLLAVALLTASASFARADDEQHWPIKPSQAAIIAQRSVPGAVVLNVKALPGGQYVVTLREGNNVLRVVVNATSGALN